MTSVEITITSILDFFPKLRKRSIYKIITITAICFIQFIASLNFTLQSGTYWIGKTHILFYFRDHFNFF